MQFFSRRYADPLFQPAKVHERFRDLDLDIVVTTNYDTIYEDCCRSVGGSEPIQHATISRRWPHG